MDQAVVVDSPERTWQAPDGILLADRPALQRLAARICMRGERGAPVSRDRERFETLRAQSAARVQARRASVPTLHYSTDLPVIRERAAIEAALGAHQVVILCGDTGSGKSTQLPKLLLGLGRGSTGMIGHTQPRRIAARSIAQRIAEELGTDVGALVGYQVRFSDRTHSSTLLKVMTDGILLAEIRADPDLLRYDTLIIDEAHERSLNVDFLLGYLRGVLRRRTDLKLIITSATIDPARFADFFDRSAVVTVAGQTYPIQTRYRPAEVDEEEAFDTGLSAGVLAAVAEVLAEPSEISRADILVFLPGEREIRDCAEALAQRYEDRLEVLALFSRLSWEQQQRVFERGQRQRQRVVLATNVAETSLTVPGVRCVVDSGLARISRYSPRAKLQRLLVEPVSQASADQRRGRSGRVGPGLCIRLYTQQDFEQRALQTPPEVQRTNLARVILQMAALGLGDCAQFAFIDPPETRLISDGYRLLVELQAVDAERQITAVGQSMARLPLDPRVARMVIAAEQLGALCEMLPLAAVLSLQDPRERPPERAALADERHSVWADASSDFNTWLNLWSAYQGQRSSLSRSALRRWCARHFLSATRMREWEELCEQLAGIAGELKWRVNEQPASYTNLHRALLCGLLSNIGTKSDEVRGEYLGAREQRFLIAPGTPLRKRAPRWIVCSQIVQTSRVYARGVAVVEPQWIEWAGRHLLKHDYLEPSWNPRRGIVEARERVSLYGLMLAADRRVDYGRIAPAEARELFVHEALVNGNSRLSAPFLTHNATLKAQLTSEEAALRRHAILVDDVAQAQFYLARIPPDVNTLDRFEGWRWQAERDAPRVLFMQEADLRQPDAPAADRAIFPLDWAVGASRLPLSYRFDPSDRADGATLGVPLKLADALDPGELDWGVEGWRLEKIIAILRGLPKAQRRELVPVPAVAERALRRLAPMRALPFYEALSSALRSETNQQIGADELARVSLPPYLRLNLNLLDAEGRVIATSRDAGDLRRAAQGAGACSAQCVAAREQPFERTGLRTWDFEVLPDRLSLQQQGIHLQLYPALADRGESAALVLLPEAARASAVTRAGVLRLLSLALGPLVRALARELGRNRELMLLHVAVGDAQGLSADIVERALLRVSMPVEVPTPRTKGQFEAARERAVRGLSDAVHELGASVQSMLAQNLQVTQALAALSPALDALLIGDLRRARARLLRPGFVAATPDPWLNALPRYLRALERRIVKLPGALGATARAQCELREHWDRYEALDALRVSLEAESPAALSELRWLTEEYAVSLFAQELKTAVVVSARRLQEAQIAARWAIDALR